MKNTDMLFLLQPPFIEGNGGLQPRGDLPHQIVQIATYIRDLRKISVAILDCFVDDLSFNDILNKIENINPLIIVMPLTIINREIDYHHTLALHDLVKLKYPQIKLVLINWFYLSDIETIFNTNENSVEYFLFGDIEDSLLGLFDFFNEKNESLDNVSGLLYKKELAYVLTAKDSRLDDLDKLPIPDWSLINIQSYKLMPHRYQNQLYYPMNIARGCDWNKCLFCQESADHQKQQQSRFIVRSPEKVVAEILFVCQKYNIREIQFDSIQFPTAISWLKKFRDLMKDNNLKINWTCLSRIDAVDLEKLKIMKECGCVNILFGIESLNIKVLKFLKKGYSKKNIFETIKNCRKVGIKTTGSFLMGVPHEKPLQVLWSALVAVVMGIDYYQLFIAKWYAQLPEKIKAYGKILPKWDYAKYDFYGPVFLPNSYSSLWQLKFIQKLAYCLFYLNPVTLVKQIFDIKNVQDLKRKYLGFVVLTKVFINKR